MKPPNPVQIQIYGFGSMQHVVHYESTFIGYKLLSRSWSASWACENPLLTQVRKQRSWQECKSSTSQRDEDYDENENKAIENESKRDKRGNKKVRALYSAKCASSAFSRSANQAELLALSSRYLLILLLSLSNTKYNVHNKKQIKMTI